MKIKRFFVAIDFSRYKGKYVAVVGKRVVASGTNAKRVWSEAKKRNPTARPELHKVPKGETFTTSILTRKPSPEQELQKEDFSNSTT